MKGQPPKSAATVKLQGNPGKRKRPAPPPEKAPEIFFSSPWDAPDWLPDGAKAIWDEQLPIVKQQSRAFQQSSLPVFANYCDAIYRLRKYTMIIETEGAVYTTASGYRRKVPEVELCEHASKQVKDLANELGLTPKSWIGQMGTFVGRQLEMELPHRGRAETVTPAPAQSSTVLPADDLNDFIGRRPTIN